MYVYIYKYITVELLFSSLFWGIPIYIYLYLYTIQCISIAMEAIWSHGPFKDDQHDGLPIKIVIFHGHVELPDSILCTYSNRQKDRRD